MIGCLASGAFAGWLEESPGRRRPLGDGAAGAIDPLLEALRVEDFPGIVILATNLKGNIDEAFARRFQSLVHFPMPDAEQRQRLWRGMLRDQSRLAKDVDAQAVKRYRPGAP